MSSKELRLRGKSKRRHEEFPLGDIPDNLLVEITKQFVHHLAIGRVDISGDDFGTIFANAITGTHLASPLGIVDVAKSKAAWSVKTVKAKSPHTTKQVRLISGRNSPQYSGGITDPTKDPDATGKVVLEIWNARVNEALEKYNDLRIFVLVRNFFLREFLVFEEEATRFIYSDYNWRYNKKGNLEGFEIETGKHSFTWQPHGSQFTIKRSVPAHARKFSISHPVPLVKPDQVLRQIKYQEDWITVIDSK